MIDIKPLTKYTIVCNHTTTGGQCIGVYYNGGTGGLSPKFPINNDGISTIVVTTWTVINSSTLRRFAFYNIPNSGSASNPATIRWVMIFEGDNLTIPKWFIPAPEDKADESREINYTSSSIQLTNEQTHLLSVVLNTYGGNIAKLFSDLDALGIKDKKRIPNYW